jgi:ribosomal protein L2
MNKFVEGKWGTSTHKFKKIVTRGVAMNPVDHPHGGGQADPGPAAPAGHGQRPPPGPGGGGRRGATPACGARRRFP